MSQRSLRYPVLAGVTLVAGSALFAWSSAGALTQPVDIQADHNLEGGEPRVLAVTGVTPSTGFELTAADEISNPDGWGGNVEVDIDPDSQQIIVQVEDSNCYDTIVVTIASSEITGVTTLSDGIYESGQGVTLSTSVSGGVTTLSWAGTDCPGLADVGAQSVFSYTEGAPTTTTTVQPSTTTTTAAPTTTAPAAAAAATVTPTFTG